MTIAKCEDCGERRAVNVLGKCDACRESQALAWFKATGRIIKGAPERREAE